MEYKPKRDTYVKTADYAEAFDALLEAVKKLIDELRGDIETSQKNLSDLDSRYLNPLSHLESNFAEKIESLKSESKNHSSKEIKAIKNFFSSELENLKDLIPEKTNLSDLYRLVEKCEERIARIPNSSKLKKELGIEVIEEDIEKLKKEKSNSRGVSVFGARGIQLYVNGVKKGMVNMINLVPGSGVSLTYSAAYGRNDITISATGGGTLSPLTATGTRNDSNTAFTFLTKPTIVVVNGASYQENSGWSWNSGTLTATLDNPVGTGGNIYGL